MAILEELAERNKSAKGPEHVDTLGTMTNLAAAYYPAGRLKDTIELQEKTFEIKRCVLPSEHPFLAVGTAKSPGLLRGRRLI